MVGTWRCLSCDADARDDIIFILFEINESDRKRASKYDNAIIVHSVGTEENPKTMHASVGTPDAFFTFYGIYSLENDILKICYNKNSRRGEPQLPDEFSEIPDKRCLIVLERVPETDK